MRTITVRVHTANLKKTNTESKASREFWELLNSFYYIHSKFKGYQDMSRLLWKYARYKPSALEIYKIYKKIENM